MKLGSLLAVLVGCVLTTGIKGIAKLFEVNS